MKIKLVLVDSDKQYVDRLLNSIVSDYEDKIEVLAYTSPEQLMEDKHARGDVYLISSEYMFDKNDFPAGCGIAYFTESKEIKSFHGEKAIAKYQRLNDIYTQVLNLYAESSGIVMDDHKNNGQISIYIITSGVGGAGKTTISVGIAQYLAMQGKKVLYISLEALGNTDVHFVRGTQGDLGDIIYMLKSKKNNISLKLKSIIQKDFMDVYYISSSENPYDLESFTQDDVKALIDEIQALDGYDCLVLDTDSSIDEKYIELLLKAEKIVYVDVDSRAAIYKRQNFITTMLMYEHKYSESIVGRVVGIMNKAERGKLPEREDEIKQVGSIGLMRGSDKQLVQSISKSDAVAGVYV